MMHGHQEGHHSRTKRGEKTPAWLRWALVFFLLSNIATIITVTFISIESLNAQIDSFGEGSVKAQEKEIQRMHLIMGTSVEVAIDIVDLCNVFVGGYAIHVTYLVVKMISVGMWAYTQTVLGNAVLWIIPIGIAMIITILLIEWYTHLRRCALITLVVIACLAWIGIVIMRMYQISHEINQTERALVQSQPRERERVGRLITDQKTNKIHIIVGSAIMIAIGTIALIAVYIGKLWLIIFEAFLQLLGIIIWTIKLVVDQIPPNSIFYVPLAYSALTLAILLLYILDLLIGPRCGGDRKAGPKSVQPKSPGGNRKRRSKLTGKKTRTPNKTPKTPPKSTIGHN